MPIIQLDFQNPLNASVQVGDIAYFANATPLGVGIHTHDPLNPQLSAPPHETAARENIIKIGLITDIKDFDGATSYIRCDMDQVLFNKYGGDIAIGGCTTTITPYTGPKTMMDTKYFVDWGEIYNASAYTNMNSMNNWGAWANSCTSVNQNNDIHGGSSVGISQIASFDALNAVLAPRPWGQLACSNTLTVTPGLQATPNPLSSNGWDIALMDTAQYDSVLNGPEWNPPLRWFFEPGNKNKRFDDYVYINYAKPVNGTVYEPHLSRIDYFTPGNTSWWYQTNTAWSAYPANLYSTSLFYTVNDILNAAEADYNAGQPWTNLNSNNSCAKCDTNTTYEEWMTACPAQSTQNGLTHPTPYVGVYGHITNLGSQSTTNCNPGSFIMFSKDNKVNQADTLGYYALVEFRNNDFSNDSELFNAGITYFNSSK